MAGVASAGSEGRTTDMRGTRGKRGKKAGGPRGGEDRGGAAATTTPEEGKNFDLKKCTAVEIELSRTKCYRVSVVSTDRAGEAVSVTWTGVDDTVSVDAVEAGRHTRCRCNMKKVVIHARLGDAVATYVTCEP
jgi:hypothetical protein